MATTARQIERSSSRRLNVLRVTVATSLAGTAFIILCWIGAVIGFGPASHMYVNMFSNAGVSSLPALLAGICWSFLGGGVIGAVYALIYNAFASLED